jgi:hypothetical protein
MFSWKVSYLTRAPDLFLRCNLSQIPLPGEERTRALPSLAERELASLNTAQLWPTFALYPNTDAARS